LVQHLTEWKRKDGHVRVLVLVLGECAGLSEDLVDFTVALNDGVRSIKKWAEVEDQVVKQGRPFDFAICSDQLQLSIHAPFLCQKMSLLAKAGYMDVPSKYRELARFQSLPGCCGSPRGYAHHRWIWTVRNGALFAYPKIPLIEYESALDAIADFHDDMSCLSLRWQGAVPLAICNNNYLGNLDIDEVAKLYRGLLWDDVDDMRKETNQTEAKEE
jgi:hypothetical protein